MLWSHLISDFILLFWVQSHNWYTKQSKNVLPVQMACLPVHTELALLVLVILILSLFINSVVQTGRGTGSLYKAVHGNSWWQGRHREDLSFTWRRKTGTWKALHCQRQDNWCGESKEHLSMTGDGREESEDYHDCTQWQSVGYSVLSIFWVSCLFSHRVMQREGKKNKDQE